VNALVSGLPVRNGWTVAVREAAAAEPASWDEAAAMSQVRRYATAGLAPAARRSRRARIAVGALCATGQEKQGSSAAGWQLADFGWDEYGLYPSGDSIFNTNDASNLGGYSDRAGRSRVPPPSS
jgi:hypothetical protein